MKRIPKNLYQKKKKKIDPSSVQSPSRILYGSQHPSFHDVDDPFSPSSFTIPHFHPLGIFSKRIEKGEGKNRKEILSIVSYSSLDRLVADTERERERGRESTMAVCFRSKTMDQDGRRKGNCARRMEIQSNGLIALFPNLTSSSCRLSRRLDGLLIEKC